MEWLLRQLEQLETRIEALEDQLLKAMGDGEPKEIINSILEEKDRVVEMEKDMRAHLGEVLCCCKASGGFIRGPVGVWQHSSPSGSPTLCQYVARRIVHTWEFLKSFPPCKQKFLALR